MKIVKHASRLRFILYALIVLLVFPLTSLAAQKRVAIKGQSLTTKQAIQLIEKNSDYTFFYNARDLNNSTKKDLNCSGTIQEVLDVVFKGEPITYMIRGNEIILKVEKKDVNVERRAPVQQPKKKIIGVVTDSKTGETLPGVSIRVKGTTKGITSDSDGKFEISADNTDVLVFTFIGYTSKEIKVGKSKVMSVTLSDETTQLADVVVTAFGVGQKKESVTGSIQSVRPGDLRVPAANLSTAFAGRLSGVIAYQRSGEPGSNGADFFIRGVSTMSGATSPLIVLDGVEVSKADLNSLDPEVIESFSVLKDATASAMYGTRGANGVLIIKTKSGQDLDRPVIGVRVESYVNTPIKRPKIADAITFMRMYNEAVTNEGVGDALYSEEKIQGTMKNLNPYAYPNVDWYGELFKNATWNQRANFNVRGGTSKITYFMNVNVSHETGMLKDISKNYFSYNNSINYMKYAFQNNVDFHLSKNSTIALHLNVQMNNMHGPLTTSGGNGVGDVFDAIMGTNAVDFPIMFPQGTDKWYHWGGIVAGNFNPVNPVAVAACGYKDDFESTVVANLNFDQKLDFITKGLGFKALVSFKNWSMSHKYRLQGYNRYQLTSHSLNDDGSVNFETSPIGNVSDHTLDSFFSTGGDRRYYVQAFMDYNRTFGSHQVSGMLLYNQDEYNANVNSDFRSSLPKRRMGFAFRASYSYKDRYMLELNAGYNGSESFAKGHRWGLFPSISAGWNVSEEPFWAKLKDTVSHLKLRGSYGLVGNDQVGSERFAYMAIVNLNGSPSYTTGYGNSTETHTGPTFNRFANDGLTWEVGHKLNFGMDLQLFNSLNITLDAFQEIRSNIFQQRGSIPNYLGTAGTAIFGNFAKVKNWGVDLAVDYGKVVNKDLTIQFKGTFTYARNKVLEYDEAANTRPALRQVGRKLNSLMGFVANGLYIDAGDIAHNPTSSLGNIAIAAGDVKYVDQPDEHGLYDGKIDANDRVALGYPTIPEIIYGFGPSIQYKNWDFSLFFQGQANVSLMMSGFAPFGTQSKNNVLQWVAEDYWSPDNQNPDAKYPRLTKSNNNNNMQSSSYWLRDASFLKLRTAEIGYKFKFARIYVSGNNLLTFSSFKLWDPEMGGGKGMSYPLQRTFNLGIQLSFK